jgi:hypothetical protein
MEAKRETINLIVSEYERGLELKKVRGTDKLYVGDRILYGGTIIENIKGGAIPTYWYDGRAGGIVEIDNKNVNGKVLRWWYYQNSPGYTYTSGIGGGWSKGSFMLLCTEETLAQAIADKAAGKVWE